MSSYSYLTLWRGGKDGFGITLCASQELFLRSVPWQLFRRPAVVPGSKPESQPKQSYARQMLSLLTMSPALSSLIYVLVLKPPSVGFRGCSLVETLGSMADHAVRGVTPGQSICTSHLNPEHQFLKFSGILTCSLY